MEPQDEDQVSMIPHKKQKKKKKSQFMYFTKKRNHKVIS